MLEFLKFNKTTLPNNNGRMYYICVKCLNKALLEVNIVKEHLKMFVIYKILRHGYDMAKS